MFFGKEHWSDCLVRVVGDIGENLTDVGSVVENVGYYYPHLLQFLRLRKNDEYCLHKISQNLLNSDLLSYKKNKSIQSYVECYIFFKPESGKK